MQNNKSQKSRTRIVVEGIVSLLVLALFAASMGMCGKFLYTGVQDGKIEAEKQTNSWTTGQCWTLRDIDHSGPSRYWILEDQSGQRTSLFVDYSCTKEYKTWQLFTVGDRLKFVRRSGSTYCLTNRLTPVRGC